MYNRINKCINTHFTKPTKQLVRFIIHPGPGEKWIIYRIPPSLFRPFVNTNQYT